MALHVRPRMLVHGTWPGTLQLLPGHSMHLGPAWGARIPRHQLKETHIFYT